MPIDPVTVRWLALDEQAVALVPAWRAVLDAEELARADRFRFAVDRQAFIAAHALARTLLSAATARPPAAWGYRAGPHGKPAMTPFDGGHTVGFNISHTRGFVACAVARDRDVGLDVEASDRRLDDLDGLSRYFTPAEAAQIRAADAERRTTLFLRFWTLKEAFIKATGEGLGRPLDSFSFTLDPVRIAFHPHEDAAADDPARWQFTEFRPTPGHLLALAVPHGGAGPVAVDAAALPPRAVATDPAAVCRLS